jgi:hypothetical protein
MKTKIIYCFLMIWLIGSCSSDDSNDIVVPEEQGFTFEVSGDIDKTISGKNAFFSTSVSQDAIDRQLFTLFISANHDNGDQVNIGITQLKNVGSGSYNIAFEIEPPYNGFVIYSEDPNNGSPIFGPIGGSIVIISVDSEGVTGAIDVQCQIPGQTSTVRIKGTFNAISDVE